MQLKLSRLIKIGLVLIAATILSAILLWLFEKQFDADNWQAKPTHRYEMVDDLIESQILIGKSKASVVELLGLPSSRISYDKDAFIYEIGDQPGFIKTKSEHLLIVFIEDKVKDVTLAFE